MSHETQQLISFFISHLVCAKFMFYRFSIYLFIISMEVWYKYISYIAIIKLQSILSSNYWHKLFSYQSYKGKAVEKLIESALYTVHVYGPEKKTVSRHLMTYQIGYNLSSIITKN